MCTGASTRASSKPSRGPQRTFAKCVLVGKVFLSLHATPALEAHFLYSAPTRCPVDATKRENSMLIRNNDGEVVGEMNTSITQEGTVIRTNTMY
jgi:hypothetical protein